MHRQIFGGPARCLVSDIFGPNHNACLARDARIFATFLISGLLHLSADLAVGITFGESGSLYFSAHRPLGSVSRIACRQSITKFSPKKRVRTRSSRIKTLEDLIGYIWLSAFLAWSTPAWSYPAMHMNQGGPRDIIWPFSVVAKLTDMAGSW